MGGTSGSHIFSMNLPLREVKMSEVWDVQLSCDANWMLKVRELVAGSGLVVNLVF